MIYLLGLIGYFVLATASISSSRVKRQFETEVRVKTSNNEWSTSYQQSLDSLIEEGVPQISSRGLPGPTQQIPEFPFRAYGAPIPGYSVVSPLRVIRRDGSSALFGTGQSSAGSDSGNGSGGSSPDAPILNYFYPDPLLKEPPNGEVIGDPHDNKYLFDMTRFDAMPGQSPPVAQGHVLKSRNSGLFGANPGALPQYFYPRIAPLTFYW